MESVGHVGILLSGGLDSCILLGKLLEEHHTVHPFFIKCGLSWEGAEQRAVQRFLEAMSRLELPGELRPLTTFQMPLSDLYGAHWSVTGENVPGYDSPDEAVFLPGRNPLLLIKAMLWCQMNQIPALALAPLASNPFGDASDAFFDSFQQSLTLAMQCPIRILRPFLHLKKTTVMRLGARYPLGLSHSCISPVHERHCGRCNKCAERQAAFRDAGMDDPTDYALPPTGCGPHPDSVK